MNMDLTIKELYRMFFFFNNHFYSNQLEKPVILIQTNGKHSHTLSWCTRKKIWNNKDGSESYYEITICGEYLDRNISVISMCMLHEMAHLYNLQNNIQDNSRGGTYHNKKFAAAASNSGLDVEFNKRNGWSLTTLKKSTYEVIERLSPSQELFKIARRLPLTILDEDEESLDEKKKSSSRKYVCPGCQTIIRATKEVYVICGDCNIDFEIEE